MKLSNELIKKIADAIDADFVCYVNPEIGEMEEMMNDAVLADYGIYWEDDDEEALEKDQASEPDWQTEMRKGAKAQMDRVCSWRHCVTVKKLEVQESFRFMEDFVEDIIPEDKQGIWWKALSRKSPFANFNDLAHNSEYRERWFEFREQGMMEHVREELGMDL